ncbi:Hypothetical protein GLP15_3165 [Giardia lamblia P15]|uniref:CCDC81 HU domain-containing protein n=1 Tax=Giardia intestinalis (strain P15) TaxID=658858 RepID=E1F7L0_GIAIA|nr:Hypothetical protein GLP15_3165 [Giardia lamblia P15]
MTTVTEYGNSDMVALVLQKPFITATADEINKVWRDLCAQVVYNYNDNCSTDIPPFAVFSFNAKGKPTARFTKTFVRNNNIRCETDEHMVPSAIRQVCYTDFSTASRHDAKTLLQFVFQELGDAIRVRAQRVNLQLPGLGNLVFDRRTRCYKFNMHPSLPHREPTYRHPWPEPKDSSETMDVTMATTRPYDATAKAASQGPFSRTMTPRANNALTNGRPGSMGSLGSTLNHENTIRPVNKQQKPFSLNTPFRVDSLPSSQRQSRQGSKPGTPRVDENTLPMLMSNRNDMGVSVRSFGATDRPASTVSKSIREETIMQEPTLGVTLDNTGMLPLAMSDSVPEVSQKPISRSAAQPVASEVKTPLSVSGTRPLGVTAEELFRTRAEEFTRDFCKTFKPPVRSHLEYGPIYERILHDELDKARDAYINSRVHGTPSTASATRPFRGLICFSCAAKKEMEAKRKANAERIAREKKEFTEQALRQAEEARREEEARKRAAYERDRSHYEYNKDQADRLYDAYKRWRRAGHNLSEGSIQPMPVLFDNDPELERRRREAAEQSMQDFIRDFTAKRQAKESEKKRSRLEDTEYAKALQEEEALRREFDRASEEAKKRLQKELLDRQLAEYNLPEFANARIPDYYDMGSALPPEDIEAILARKRREAEDVRDTALRDATAKRMRDKLQRAKEEADDMAAYLKDLEDAANERRCRAEHERAVREQMLKDMEAQIAEKNRRKLQEKLDAMRPPSRECFRSEEDEPTCPCDCCGKRVKVSQLLAL